MATVQFRFESGDIYAIEVAEGSNLLLEAVQQAVPLSYRCTTGKCGTCLVRIDKGLEETNQETIAEQRQLADQQLAQGYRLACQTYAFDDLVVEVE